MTSLLAYAWRKNRQQQSQVPALKATNANNGVVVDDDLELPHQVLLTASSSSSSGEEIPSIEQTSSFKASTTKRRVSVTPEGLKPRRSIVDMRQRLGLPPLKSNRLTWGAEEKKSSEGILPPTSPQVSSTSSFYAGSEASRNHKVAASPVLVPGQARTAVGALLAKQSKAPPTSPLRQQQLNEEDDVSLQSNILPPRPTNWIEPDEENNHLILDDSVDESTIYTHEQYYQELNDSKLILTPPRDGGTSSSTSMGESTLHASPSSNNWGNNYNTNNLVIPDDSSRKGLTDASISEEAEQGQHYDLNPILVDQDLYVPQHNVLNVSSLSHSTRDANSLAIQQDLLEQELQQHIYEESHTWDQALLRQKMINQRRSKEDLIVSLLTRFQDEPDILIELLIELEDAAANQERSGRCISGSSENLLMGYSTKTRTEVTRTIDAILNELRVSAPEDFILSPSQAPELSETHLDLEQALLFCRSVISSTAVVPLENKKSAAHSQPPSTKPHWRALVGFRSKLGLEEVPESPPAKHNSSQLVDEAPTPMTSNLSMGTSISSPLQMRQFDQPNQDGLRQRRTLEAFATLLDRLSKAILELQTPTTHSKACIHATDEIKRVYLLLLSLDRGVLKLLLDSFQLEFPKIAAYAVPSTSSAAMIPLEDARTPDDIVEASEEAIECSRAPSPTTQPEGNNNKDRTDTLDDDRDDNDIIVKDSFSPPRLTETETTEASSSDLGDDYEHRDDEGVEVDELRRAISVSFDNNDRHIVDNNDDEVRDGVPLLSPDDQEADPQPAVRSNKPKTRKSWFRRRIKNRKSYISAE